jgi:hypothetical protein
MTKLYEADFYTWAMTQADAARRRSANELDWENVAEELETLGRSEARELYSRYIILITHLLKWMHQPARRSKGWLGAIGEQRTMLAKSRPAAERGRGVRRGLRGGAGSRDERDKARPRRLRRQRRAARILL